MRRKGPIAESSNGEELKQRCTGDNGAVNGTPSTVGSSFETPTKECPEARCKPPPPHTPVVEQRKRTDGFLAFFARADKRQIKKIVYPHDKKSNRRRQLRLMDVCCLCVVGLLCIGVWGVAIGFQQQLDFYFWSRRPTIRLPPNSIIPPQVQQSVKRRQLPLPLMLEGVFARGSSPNQLTMTGSFEYPADQLDNRTILQEEDEDLPIPGPRGVHKPPDLDDQFYYQGNYRDFGPVDIRFLTQEGQARTIYRERWETDGRARRLGQQRDDDTEPYWAFDDWLRNPYVTFDDNNIQDTHHCRRTNWHRQSFHTGNLLHELDLVTHTPTLVGEGAYREVFIVERPVLQQIEQFVLKEIRFDSDQEYDCHEYVRVDALVTERMTSNTQVVDLYGYSGWSMLAECFIYGDVEDDIVGFHDRISDFDPFHDPELRTWNNFTGSQKLKLALSMVQPVAALHHYKDGVIIHDDIQLSQFLWTDATKTSVKLNDFNRAEVMFWDEEHQEYCKFRNGRGGGDWRAPEEYRDDPLNEKIDVWSLGNNFYSLLGGYYPFPNIEEFEAIRRKLARGGTAKIDPRFYHRSFAEHKLIEVIKRCHVHNIEERASIKEIQEILEVAIAEDEKRKEEGQDEAIGEYYGDENEDYEWEDDHVENDDDHSESGDDHHDYDETDDAEDHSESEENGDEEDHSKHHETGQEAEDHSEYHETDEVEQEEFEEDHGAHQEIGHDEDHREYDGTGEGEEAGEDHTKHEETGDRDYDESGDKEEWSSGNHHSSDSDDQAGYEELLSDHQEDSLRGESKS